MTTTHTSVEAGLPESLRLVEQYDHGNPEAHGNAWKVAVCNELRSQYAELTTLRAKLKTCEFSDHQSPPVAQEAQKHVEIPAKCPYFGPSPLRDVWLEGWYAACATQPSPVAQGDALDTERLDFLIENRAYVVSDDTSCDGYWLRFPADGGTTSVQIGEYETPREAIDAARASQEGKSRE